MSLGGAELGGAGWVWGHLGWGWDLDLTQRWRTLLLRIGEKCSEYGRIDDFKDHIESCYGAIRRELEHSGDDILPHPWLLRHLQKTLKPLEKLMASRSEPQSPISFSSLLCRLRSEALPLVTKFKLLEEPFSEFPKGVPWVRYCGKYKGLTINILCPGKDATGVDSVGTVSTSLVAYASIVGLKPDLVINAGTAGGFKEKSACIGDVFVVSDVAFKAVHFLSLLEDQKVWNSNLLKWASGLISGGDNLKKIDRTYRNIPWRPIAGNYCIPKC